MKLIKHKNKNYIKSETGYREVLATTDTKLKVISTCCEGTGYDKRSRCRICDGTGTQSLPQPSQAFIEKYCKVGGIDEVLVEYETIFLPIDELPSNQKHVMILKVNSNNEIIIHPIKNSWSREEVIKLLETYYHTTKGYGLTRNEFIKKYL